MDRGEQEDDKRNGLPICLHLVVTVSVGYMVYEARYTYGRV